MLKGWMSRSQESHPTSLVSVREENCSAFPKGKMGKRNVPCVELNCHSDTLSCALSVPYFFPVAIILSSLSFPALPVTDVAFSVPAAPQNSDLYKICISTFSAEQIKS